MASNQSMEGAGKTTAEASPAGGVLAGLPVAERRLDLAAVSTSVLEGGSGPPTLLLHGQGGFAAMWGAVIGNLARSHRVVAPDLPGLGRSEVRGSRLDGPAVVAWLRELIAQTCAEPPTVVGISLGGSFAALFGIDHSELVRRIVLVDSGSLGPFRPRPSAVLALIRYLRHPNPATFDRFFSRVFVDPERVKAAMGERWTAFQAYHIDRTSQPSVRAANRQLLRRVGVRRIAAERLRKISAPVALIWGRNDPIMPFRIAEAASSRFGWPLYPIEDCGHVPFAEQPGQFYQALGAAMEVGA